MLNKFYRVGQKTVGGTRIGQVAKRVFDRFVGVVYGRQLSKSGFYRIRPPGINTLISVYLPSPESRFLLSRYERPVLEYVMDNVDEHSVFWEVGARWGYYSFPAAELGADVFAFEKIPEQVECLQKTKHHNSFDNVSIVEGMAGEDYSLDEFPTPDLAVIDVEGREYELLKNAPLLLESEPTLIIELHGNTMSSQKKMGKSPEAVEELLKESGFTLSVLERRRDENYHILAEG